MQKITTNLWYDFNQALEAAEFYVSVFGGDSRIVHVARYPEGSPGPAGEPMVVEWELRGQRFMGINGGPAHKLSEVASLLVTCDDQEEIDYFWDALRADGGEEGPCGWLKDRFGLSWQVVPGGMDEFFSDPDKGRVERAMKAMLGMKKIDIAAMRAAADGETTAA